MNAKSRAVLGIVFLLGALGAEAAVERATETERPPLNQPLASLPMQLGEWVGVDEPVEEKIARESQATEFVNRRYTHVRFPDRQMSLWMNYSEYGLNMRHSPEVCLPSGGWTKVESMTREEEIPCSGSTPQRITLLGYTRGELVQRIGFWYYIFGEGPVERFVRELPITSRSSHGRTTRGSGLTVELFYPGESAVDDEAVRDFAEALLTELDSLLPENRASYHIP